MLTIPAALAVALLVAWTGPAAAIGGVEQLYVSYAADPGTVWVSWARVGEGLKYAAPRCAYGPDPSRMDAVARAAPSTYRDGCGYGECAPWNGTLFAALLTDLPFDAEVFYRCGDDVAGFSAVSSFVSPPNPNDTSFPEGGWEFALTADVGFSENARRVRDDMLATVGTTPRFFHIAGDVAYADGNQSGWDEFNRLWEPVFSRVPTLMSPGNHDGGAWRWVEGRASGSGGRGGRGLCDKGCSQRHRPPPPPPSQSGCTGTTTATHTASGWAVATLGRRTPLATRDPDRT